MAMIPFTNNYEDKSTNEGYQFEFFCQRCNNGYSSTFKHSVTGFGGMLAQIGGSLLGGNIGDKIADAGYNAQWMRSETRGSTRDGKLREAVEEMQPYFRQCNRCGQWVCEAVCWNNERGMCVTCAPKLDQEIAGMQAEAQIRQLSEKIQAQDWTADINITDEATGMCPSCGKASGGGKFCQSCGTPLAAAPASSKKFCGNCGTEIAAGKKFCSECGTPAG